MPLLGDVSRAPGESATHVTRRTGNGGVPNMWRLCSALILLIILLPAGPLATTFQVTNTADANGSCTPGNCSLREAIEAANANPGADDVPVPAGTYLLSLGQLTVSDDVAVTGADEASTVIDGNNSDRVFHIQSSTVAEISNVTIQYGDAYPWIGGGILNYGDLTLANSTVRRNRASDYLFQGIGGGIFNGAGTLNLINSTVSSNTVAGEGGGIFNSAGTVTLTNSTVSGNNSGDAGGGILNDGTLTLTNSTVSDNSALNDIFDGNGGGISNSGGLTLTNSTVSANYAGYYYPPYFATGWGGGISNTGTVTMINSTVSGNRAYQSGGGISNANTVTLSNTIVADNEIDNCSGSVDSLGYNLADDTSCGVLATGDLVVADAMLGPLTDNGGPTETRNPLPGSPVIDAGSVNCPPPTTDQRGVARPQGADCDIGAVEYLPEPGSSEMLIAGAALLGLLYRRRVRGLRIG
jgi:CSLREA domain-containing protein